MIEAAAVYLVLSFPGREPVVLPMAEITACEEERGKIEQHWSSYGSPLMIFAHCILSGLGVNVTDLVQR
ncbi:hypothetical protein ACFHWW_23060 [Ensifer sp. P24N7]|uniref:hypothetical protein n=1 Tax=Sinorhizobium sp. P24N7 TaxID=3348358 RepID=UPI0035F4B386